MEEENKGVYSDAEFDKLLEGKQELIRLEISGRIAEVRRLKTYIERLKIKRDMINFMLSKNRNVTNKQIRERFKPKEDKIDKEENSKEKNQEDDDELAEV